MQVAEKHSPIESDVSIERGFIGYVDIFNDLIRRRWGDSVTPTRTDIKAEEDVFMECEDDVEEPRIILDIGEFVESTGRLLNQQSFYDILMLKLSCSQGS